MANLQPLKWLMPCRSFLRGAGTAIAMAIAFGFSASCAPFASTPASAGTLSEIKHALFVEIAPTSGTTWVVDDATLDEIAKVGDIRRFKVIKRSRYNPKRDKNALSVAISVREARESKASCVFSGIGGPLTYTKRIYELIKKRGQWEVVSSRVEEFS
jgi:hypothetical protein